MSPVRARRAGLLARALCWLALGVGLGLAFGDSLGRAVLWVLVAVAIGLLHQRRHAIAAGVRRRRR